jgi:hypothetical protein
MADRRHLSPTTSSLTLNLLRVRGLVGGVRDALSPPHSVLGGRQHPPEYGIVGHFQPLVRHLAVHVPALLLLDGAEPGLSVVDGLRLVALRNTGVLRFGDFRHLLDYLRLDVDGDGVGAFRLFIPDLDRLVLPAATEFIFTISSHGLAEFQFSLSCDGMGMATFFGRFCS